MFTLTLPEGIEGSFQLFFVADSGAVLYEKDLRANNVSLPVAITITDLKPDLQVQSASAPAAGTARQFINVDFSIVNAGARLGTIPARRGYHATPTSSPRAMRPTPT